MSAFNISFVSGVTIVEQLQRPFKMDVQKNRKLPLEKSTAILEATLYKEDGIFVKDGSYIFEALDTNNQPLCNDVNIEDFKATVDFFFISILGTDLFVKSVPKSSCLCEKEMKHFQFE